MNKKYIIILTISSCFLIILLASLFFVFFVKPKEIKTPSQTVNPTQNSKIKYTANLQITKNNPQELKIVLNNPPEKGITGIQIYLKISPALKSPLKIDDIIETLPKPWQYIKKEVNNDNEIVISAIYLQSGVSGDKNKEYSVAKINLPLANELSETSLDLEKSKIYGKQSGLEISFDNKLYSK